MSMRNSRQDEIIKEEELDKKVMIIGCGATGTWTGIQLAMLGVKNLWLMDNDVVSIHNLNRQIFTEDQVNKSKVEEFGQFLRKINSEINIYVINQKLIDINQIPKDIDVIFGCVDNLRARKIMQDYIQKNKKSIIIEMGTTTGYPFMGTCCEINYKQLYKKFIPDFDKRLSAEDKTPSCSIQPAQAIVPTSACIASASIGLFIDYIQTGKIHPELFGLNLKKTPSIDAFEVEK